MRKTFPFTNRSNRVYLSALPGNVSQNENPDPPCGFLVGELFIDTD